MRFGQMGQGVSRIDDAGHGDQRADVGAGPGQIDVAQQPARGGGDLHDVVVAQRAAGQGVDGLERGVDPHFLQREGDGSGFAGRAGGGGAKVNPRTAADEVVGPVAHGFLGRDGQADQVGGREVVGVEAQRGEQLSVVGRVAPRQPGDLAHPARVYLADRLGVHRRPHDLGFVRHVAELMPRRLQPGDDPLQRAHREGAAEADGHCQTELGEGGFDHSDE